MKKNILIICSIAFIAILSFVFITTALNNVNHSIEELNKELINGDENYNKAVIDLNNQNFDSAASEFTNAVYSFQKARDILKDLDNNNNLRLNNELYSTYFDLTSNEFENKQSASTLLLNATIALKRGDVSSGNNYIYNAGYAMSEALNYQSQRSDLVKNYPDKFENSTNSTES